MLIPTSDIADWQDLQGKVAMLFLEMGYHAESPRSVELAGRGKKEVDVFILDERASVNQIMLVECKFWSRPVDQEVVHSMRTVMEGSGANTGFIISKMGFQRGAREAVNNTNIHLLTWEELQHTFGRQWLSHKSEMLEKTIIEMRGVDHAHLAQYSPLITTHNNMFFESTKLLGDLYKVLADIRTIIFAATAQPKSYEESGPFEVQASSNLPLSHENANGMYVVTLDSVRSYFDWIMPIASNLLAEYKSLSTRAHEDFDNLPREEGDAAFERSLQEIAHETPIRVFREDLGEKTYAAILARVRGESR